MHVVGVMNQHRINIIHTCLIFSMDHTSMYYKEVSQKTKRQIIQTNPIRRQVADLHQVKL